MPDKFVRAPAVIFCEKLRRLTRKTCKVGVHAGGFPGRCAVFFERHPEIAPFTRFGKQFAPPFAAEEEGKIAQISFPVRPIDDAAKGKFSDFQPRFFHDLAPCRCGKTFALLDMPARKDESVPTAPPALLHDDRIPARHHHHDGEFCFLRAAHECANLDARNIICLTTASICFHVAPP